MWSNNDSSAYNETSFMNTSANSTLTDNKTSNIKRSQNCIPVMIEHLNRYSENLSVWGMPAKMITFVGIACEIESVSTKVNFRFRDETGTIKGVKWIEADNTSFENSANINRYVRVYGTMRSQNNENYVLVINIEPMRHLNELLVHLMEVTVMSLEGEKMMNKVEQNDNLLLNKSMNVNANEFDNTAVDNPFGLGKEQAIVLKIIQTSASEYGAERDEIKSKVPKHIVHKVDEILEFLSSEGHVYTTKTDDYFKVI